MTYWPRTIDVDNGSGGKFAEKLASDNWLLLDDGETPNPDYKDPPLKRFRIWDDAIGLIDRYPWAMLVPLAGHPEFKKAVLVEVTRRLTGDHSKYAWSPEDFTKKEQ